MLETQRLLLTPLDRTHADELHTLWTQPDVRRYLWDDRILSSSETLDILRRNEELFARNRFGLWSIRRKTAPALCGFIGFWYFREPPELELVLGLGADYCRQGFATEAGLAAIRHGFCVLVFDRIRGSADAANQRSIRLMERLGMRYQTRDLVAGADTVFFEIER